MLFFMHGLSSSSGVSLESPNSLNGFLIYCLTIFGKRIIFIGDRRKIEASIIIANFLTIRSLLKLKSSLTNLTGIKA